MPLVVGTPHCPGSCVDGIFDRCGSRAADQNDHAEVGDTLPVCYHLAYSPSIQLQVKQCFTFFSQQRISLVMRVAAMREREKSCELHNFVASSQAVGISRWAPTTGARCWMELDGSRTCCRPRWPPRCWPHVPAKCIAGRDEAVKPRIVDALNGPRPCRRPPSRLGPYWDGSTANSRTRPHTTGRSTKPLAGVVVRGLVVLVGGAPGRIRTCGTRFRRAVLYPLSYGGVSSLAGRA